MEFYTYILSHKKNEFESVLGRWRNLEPVIQSEVSQKKKNKYRILMHIYEILKIVLMDLFTGKEWRCRCREWTYGHSGEGREWDQWRKCINIYILSSVRWIACEKLLCSTGRPV